MVKTGTVAKIAWQSPRGNILAATIWARKKKPPTGNNANNFNSVGRLKGPIVDEAKSMLKTAAVIIIRDQMKSICTGAAFLAYLVGNSYCSFAESKPTYPMKELLNKKHNPATPAPRVQRFLVLVVFFPWLFFKMLF